MGLLSRFRASPDEGLPTVTMDELVSQFEVVEVTPNGVLVTQAPVVEAAGKVLAEPSLQELGSASPSSYSNLAREEYNPELRGLQGLQKYDRMRRNDAQVRATLRLVKTPILAARWYMEPASLKKQDVEVAKFVWDNLTKWMSTSFPQFITESLFMLEFGYYMFEKVFAVKDDQIIWKKFAPRHPMDAQQWIYDAHGGPRAVEFIADPITGKTVTISIKKLLVFTFDKEGGHIEGLSLLRSAYKHWYYKENLYKIDAIQKERHGIGVPVIKLPPNFTNADKNLADELGKNLRTNERAHITLPPMWDIMMLKMEGQPVDAVASAEHHDLMIARNVLGQFINDTSTMGDESQQQLFLKATRFIADTIRDVINKYAIPELVDYNFEVDEYPELRVRRIGDTVDWRTISFAIRNFIGAGVLRPDDHLEKWVRDEMDLPLPDLSTTREMPTPQGPGGARVGLPRQSRAGSMNVSPGSSGRIGRDGRRS